MFVRGRLRVSQPSAPGGIAPSSPTHQGAAGETLPQLERCFETVEGERRQVPCPYRDALLGEGRKARTRE